MKNILFLISLTVILVFNSCSTNDGWISLFDGKSMDGWKPSENKNSWKVEDGMLVTRGDRSHLFYDGNVNGHNFINFEFTADVKTEPGSNSGLYIHTQYQEIGWPAKGYECQVINSSPNAKPGDYIERKLTGSLYAIRNVWKTPVKDGEWFNYRIVVQGKTIRTYLNNRLMVDYTEPENTYRPESMKGRLLSSGTFALQCHDPKSVVYYKNIKVKVLPDDLPTPGTPQEDAAFERKLIDLANQNFPLMDLHTHLKGGLTADQALAHARIYGFTYGIAINCGLKMGFETEDSLKQYMEQYSRPPEAYFAMQAEGREWLDMFSMDIIKKFDYVFTDAMTWTNKNGTRMRLWIKDELDIGEPQDFMNQLVDNAVKIITTEPINIWVNPSYLPEELASRYDELWTEDRMDRVVEALAKSGVAMEINARFKLPSAAFIKKAKAAGVKFTFGTNNGGADDLGRLDYCIQMVEECGLKGSDMWIPGGK
jgi:hypothetical protein